MKSTADSLLARAESAARALSTGGVEGPEVALILGSGLSGVVESIQKDLEVPTADLLGSPAASVAGHSGDVVLGSLCGVRLLTFVGRIHLYEGHTPDEQTLPVLLSSLLGAKILVLTNASGGIKPGMRRGDLMVISDQINLTGRTVVPPGADLVRGDRELYDSHLAGLLQKSAWLAGVPAHRGVYAGGLGPSYETAAEIRMLRRLGADAVGMSTVLEALAGRRLGMRIAGLSVITNLGTGISPGRLSHEEVTAGGASAGESVRKVLAQFLSAIGQDQEIV